MLETKEKFYTCPSDRAFKEVFMRDDSKDTSRSKCRLWYVKEVKKYGIYMWYLFTFNIKRREVYRWYFSNTNKLKLWKCKR